MKKTQTDAAVHFDWGDGAPVESMSADTYSVRWTGKVSPQYDGLYTFYTNADGGVKLWVDNRLIINKWQDQGAVESTGTIRLQAGRKYDIRLEYVEHTGSAAAKLSWSSSSQPKQVIQQDRLYPE